jgi:hypothetical protein
VISFDALGQAWLQFFHAPEPVAALCLFRIAFGLLLAFNAACLLPYADDLFGPFGVFGTDSFKHAYRHRRLSVFHLLPRSTRLPKAVVVMWLLASLAVAAGFMTWLTTPLAWLCLASLHHRNPVSFNSGDSVQRLLLLLLCFAPSGAALSVDCWLRGDDIWSSLRDKQFDPWAVRLMQIQISIIYIRTVGWKLRGKTWRNGTAVAYSLRVVDFRRFPVPTILFHRAANGLLTYGTLVMEAFVGIGVWFSDLRYAAIFAGWVLHAGIETFINVHLFGLAMGIGLMTFLPPQDVADWLLSFR